MTYQDKFMGWLPDSYAKDEDTNNYKLFNIVSPEYDLIKETCIELEKSLDIEYAYGDTLNKIATNVNQSRGQTNDTVLRTLIKAKIAADMSEGTIKTLLEVIGFILGDNENKSQIIELFNRDPYFEEAAFQVIAPLNGIIEAGITLGQFVQLIFNIKAAGVRIIADLQGTFEFGTVDQYGQSYETGFSDDTQEPGGSLGVLFDSDTEVPLPI